MSNIEQRSHVSRSIRKHLFAGLAAGVALLAGVGGWAATTNLAGAVVASTLLSIFTLPLCALLVQMMG